tara:strand:- start:950 stop:1102 length:153 start_codon:yes stop_codon:yes gene_type:complete
MKTESKTFLLFEILDCSTRSSDYWDGLTDGLCKWAYGPDIYEFIDLKVEQ